MFLKVGGGLPLEGVELCVGVDVKLEVALVSRECSQVFRGLFFVFVFDDLFLCVLFEWSCEQPSILSLLCHGGCRGDEKKRML